MAKYSGENLVVMFGVTELSGKFRTFETTEEGSQYDQTAGAETEKTYLPGKKDGNATLSCLAEAATAGTAMWAAVIPNTEGTVTWYPEGTAVASNRHAVNALIKTRSRRYPYDNVVELTVTFQFSGAITDDVVPE